MQRVFSIPTAGPASNLAWDGRGLWFSVEGSTDEIYLLNPRDGTILRSFAGPASQTLGLAVDGRTLFNSDAGTDLIYQLSLQ